MTTEETWLREHRKSTIDPKDFHRLGWIDDQTFEKADQLTEQLNFRIPQRFSKDVSQNKESIAKQFVPSLDELTHFQNELDDPIGDQSFEPVPGIVHRYPDRVLLKATHHCAVYCRFCFRREKVSHEGHELKGPLLAEAISYIESNPNIKEVIFSGGDPFTLTNKRLKSILDQIKSIQHVKILRFHTRIPTVLPSRITESFITLLKSVPKTIWIVAHINSVDELNESAERSLALLADSGFPLLHQGVLLKGVNDSAEALSQLMNKLMELRVKPYYLHYPDLAKGTQHFRIPLSRAISLIKSLRGRLSGYGVPQLCVDIPGGGGKIVVAPELSRAIDENHWEFISPITGKKHLVHYS